MDQEEGKSSSISELSYQRSCGTFIFIAILLKSTCTHGGLRFRFCQNGAPPTFLHFNSEPVIPAPIFIGINSSRNPLKNTGFRVKPGMTTDMLFMEEALMMSIEIRREFSEYFQTTPANTFSSLLRCLLVPRCFHDSGFAHYQ